VKEDLGYLKSFDEAIKAGFVNNAPLHVADPEKSVFAIMTESDFDEKTVEQIQEILLKKHIIVKDMRSTPLQFDARGLKTLTGLSTVTDMQGV
jgi:hypothetical protein